MAGRWWEEAGSHRAVSCGCSSTGPHPPRLKITPTFYLTALEVRSLTWVSRGHHQSVGRMVILPEGSRGESVLWLFAVSRGRTTGPRPLL